MAERLAKALVTLRTQVNEARKGRDKASDGWIGDPAHRGRKSDHNPNPKGVVTAIDIDENLSAGEDAATLVKALIGNQVNRKRLKYIIYEGRITDKNDITKWKPYSGTNAHKHHVHISAATSPQLHDDPSLWDLTGWADQPAGAPPDRQGQPELQRGDKGPAVVKLQLALRARGSGLNADGDFGEVTEAAVRRYQRLKGLKVDGIAGRNTNASLGLV